MRKYRGKRILALLLTMVMLFGMAPDRAFAAGQTGGDPETEALTASEEPAFSVAGTSLPETTDVSAESAIPGEPAAAVKSAEPEEPAATEKPAEPEALAAPAPVVLYGGTENEVTVSVENAAPGSVLSVEEAAPSDYDALIRSIAGEDCRPVLALDIKLSPKSESTVRLTVKSALFADPDNEGGELPVLYHVHEKDGVRRAGKVDYIPDGAAGTASFEAADFSPFVFVAPAEEETVVSGESAGKADTLGAEEPKLSEERDDDGQTKTGVEINDFSASLSSGGSYHGETDAGIKQYVWHSNVSDPGHSFIFKIDYRLQIHSTQEPGAIEMRIPKHILKNRSGVIADRMDFSIPSEEDIQVDDEGNIVGVSEKVFFAYKEDPNDENSYLIYNFRQLKAPLAMEGFLELAYLTTDYTVSYRDCDFENDQGSSDVFRAVIQVTGPDGNRVESVSDGTEVYIDSHVNLLSAKKLYPTLYRSWEASWGDKPAWADKYWYLLWAVASVVEDGSNQPYSFSITDDPITEDMRVVGIRWAGDLRFSQVEEREGGAAFTFGPRENQTATRTRYDYILTALPINVYQFRNPWRAVNIVPEITLEPKDRVDPVTRTSTEEAIFEYETPAFSDPEGHFDAWDRADGARRRYGNIYEETSGSAVFNRLNMHADFYSRYDLNDFGEHDGLIGKLTNTDPSNDAFNGVTVDGVRDASTAHYGGLDFAIWVWGTPAVLTKDWMQHLEENHGYFEKPVIYDLATSDVWIGYIELEGNEAVDKLVPLGAGDYEITSVQYDYILYDGELNEYTQKFSSKPVTLQDDDVIYFYGQFADGWKLLLSYNLKTGERVYANGASAISNSEFNPGPGCLHYRAVMRNRHYYTTIGTVANYRLFYSPTVKQVVDNRNMIFLRTLIYADLYTTWTSRTQGCRMSYDPDQQKDVVVEITHSGEDLTGWSWADHGTGLFTGEDDDPYYRYFHLPFTDSDTVNRQDSDYARVAERKSDLGKRIRSASNNTKTAQFIISWQIDMQETVTYGDSSIGTSTTSVTQEGGVFYDLLPKGATVDKNEVAVTSDGSYLPGNAYDVELIDNYRGSGQTMMIVRIHQSGANYSLFYDSYHSWESIKDYGKEVYNPVAYETGNADIYNGYANPVREDGSPVIRSKDLMSDLDPDTTSKRFLYAEREYDIYALYAASVGMTKEVKAVNDTYYKRSTYTTADGSYSYRIRFAANKNTTAREMILLDCLESNLYSEGSAPDWFGELSAIDLSQLRSKGIDPKVYIYTGDRQSLNSRIGSLSLGTIADELASGEWQLVDSQTDLSAARAVAIDMSTGLDGQPFVLQEEDAISAVLYMKAPSAENAPNRANGYPETQNSVTMLWSFQQPGFPEPMPMNTHVGPAIVKYRITGDVSLKKVSVEEPDLTIQGASFRLTGTSHYGNSVDLTLSTGVDGKLGFKQVERGLYILQEVSTPPDWLLDPAEYQVFIDGKGRVWITKDGFVQEDDGTVKTVADEGEDFAKPYVYVEEDGAMRERIAPDAFCFTDTEGSSYKPVDFTVKNEPRVWKNVVFRKTSTISTRGIAGVSFLLTGISSYGNRISELATSDSNGVVTFKNIEMGSNYQLTESGAHQDYLPLSADIRVKVDENGVVIYEYDESAPDKIKADSVWVVTDADSGQIQIKNTPRYWGFSFYKVEEGNEALKLFGAVFTLKGVSDKGTPVDLTASSDEYGEVSFEHLEAGTYSLLESSAPKDIDHSTGQIGTGDTVSYQADPKEYDVVVSEDGIVTIDGQPTRSSGSEETPYYNFPNPQQRNGRIVVTKYWDDGLTGTAAENREEPVFHIQTSNDLASVGYAVIFNANGGWFDNGSNLSRMRFANGAAATGTEPGVSRYGYIFDGWTRADGTPFELDGSYSGPSDLTVYAKWLLPQSKDFDYTGEVQTYEVQAAGMYRLEVWGAYGGAGKNQLGQEDETIKGKGGAGGYVSGYAYLNPGDVLYVYVGGSTTTGKGGWNGGGDVWVSPNNTGTAKYGGGGATDISIQGGAWDSESHLHSRLIVAAGGGGWNGYMNEGTDADQYRKGGDGGAAADGWSGSPGINLSTRQPEASGGTLSLGGKTTGAMNSGVVSGSFGKGGSGGHGAEWLGAGGGGWYGGGCGSGANKNGSGAGGSSYAWTDEVTVGGKLLSEYYPGARPDDAYKLSYVTASVRTVDEALATADGHARISYMKPNMASQSGNDSNSAGNAGRALAPRSLAPANPQRDNGSGEQEEKQYDSESAVYDEQEQTGWKKVSDDVWTYTFKVDDADAVKDFLLWEDEYSYAGQSYEGDALADSKKAIRHSDGFLDAVITNTVPRGTLIIEKTVFSSDSSTAPDTEFSFTVQLTDKNNQALSGKFGDLRFNEEGKAVIKLRNRGSITIPGLPLGTSYTVTETDPGAPFSFMTPEGTVSGTIEEARIYEEGFENLYTKPVIKTVDVILEKHVTGRYEEAGSFEIQAIFTNLIPDAPYNYYESDHDLPSVMTANENGNAVLTLSMTDGKTVRFSAINVGATYQFTEPAGDWIAGFEISNAASAGSIKLRRAVNTEKDTALITAVETADEGEEITVSFNNQLQQTGSLILTKVVDGLDYGRPFPIKVIFKDLEPNKSYRTYKNNVGSGFTGKANDNGELELNAYVRAGEEYRIEGLPVGAKYQVSESTKNEAAWYQPESFHYTLKDGTEKSGAYEPNAEELLTTEEETLKAFETVTVKFVNENKTGQLLLSKLVEGNMANRNKTFRFLITMQYGYSDENGRTSNQLFSGSLPAKRSGSDTTETLQFTDGVCTVTLRHGESLEILEIPAGFGYTVAETNPGQYSVKVNGENAEQTTGVIQADATAQAAFVNTLNIVIPTGLALRDAAAWALTLSGLSGLLALLLARKRRKE